MAKAEVTVAPKEMVGGAPWRIREWFKDLDPAMESKFKAYQEELLKFNKAINLVSPKTAQSTDLIHFSDCILASRILMESESPTELYDFGSGNGFPGLVFGILYSKVMVRLVESDLRKCEFLKQVIGLVGAKNIEVLNRTVETLPEGSVKLAVCRGFAPLSRAILNTRKVFSKGGVFIHLKGEEWASEIASIPTQLCSYWAPSLIKEYKLPIGEIKYAIVKTVKIDE